MAVVKPHESSYDATWSGEPRYLKNLKIVEYCGPSSLAIKEHFVTLLPELQTWTNFQVHQRIEAPESFYMENLETCGKVPKSELVKSIQNAVVTSDSALPWDLFPELLVNQVMKITHENVPEEFCCLATYMEDKRCRPNIKDTKRLLENPESQFSYLYISNPIEFGCDVHLVASAFPNLTELVISGVTRDPNVFPKDAHFERRLRKRASGIRDKDDQCSLNCDSSFKMLVENTPQLKHLTLGGMGRVSPKDWDLDELYLISNWEHLETLCLSTIPIENGDFLIDIGKRCKNLQKLALVELGAYDFDCYKKGLLQMLKHCQNLRDFSIESRRIRQQLSGVFDLLVNNIELERVYAKDINHKEISVDLVSSIEQLLQKCSKLTTFVYANRFSISDRNQLREAKKR